ncbi:MAG: hypothetical protein WA813_16115 [Beijerinckiaceae bacterium]
MEITKVPFTTGQLIRQMVRLAHTLQTVPEDERQRAILLAKTEAQYICQTLLTSADMIRILEGRPAMMPHPEV